MNYFLERKFHIFFAILVTLLSCQSISIPQPTKSAKISPIKYEYPKNNKLPSIDNNRGTRWKGRRDICDRPIALTPNKQGITVSANPTLWFYLQDVSQLSLEIEFSGKWEETYQYQAKPNTTIETGIMGIPISTKSLDPDLRYHWRLSYRCQDQLSDSQQLTGEIYRLNRADENDINHNLISSNNSQDKIAIYLKYSVWHDSLSELFKLRQQQPKNPVWTRCGESY
jgi:hypothetical protein